MDADAPVTEHEMTESDGQYVRRAEALMARRAELFATAPALSLRRVAPLGPQQRDRSTRPARTAGRQLSLPIVRERGRRQARMLR